MSLLGALAELEVYLGHGWSEKIEKISKDDLEAVGRNVANKKVSAVTHREWPSSRASYPTFMLRNVKCSIQLCC